LIKGQEDYVCVSSLGIDGLGEGFDKLVTGDVNPKSKSYGKVIHSVSTGARVEAHHVGLTDDRRYIWAGGLSDNRIWVFDVDPEGCPLGYRVFDLLKRAIATNAALHGKVRFVTLSFDPARDNPDVMRQYAASRAVDTRGGLRWCFLTTRSARELMPLVEGFGQDVRVTFDRSSGRPRRKLSHVLKVFLIDRRGDVREIYSSLFLHPQTVLNDIATLLMEDGSVSRSR
jgi:SCO1/SenC family protein